MKKRTFALNLLIISLSIFTIGCKGTAPTNQEKEPVQLNGNTEDKNQTEVKTHTIGSEQFSGGVITEPVVITGSTKDAKSSSEITIPTGTTFEDENGNTLEDISPVFEITQKKGNLENASNQSSIVQTEIKTTDEKGNKIIPTEPITVKMKAPEGVKPGEEVKLSLPEGSTAAEEKLILVIVDAHGFVTIKIAPRAFRKFTVIVIIIQRIKPVTGGEGGN